MQPHRTRFTLALAFLLATSITAADASQHLSSEHAWQSYRQRSLKIAELQRDTIATELEQVGLPELIEPPVGPDFEFDPRVDDEWYKSEQGRTITRNIITFQSPSGGWSKRVDMTTAPRSMGVAFGSSPKYTATFDNDATVSQLRHLARAYRVTGDKEVEGAFLRGMHFVFNAQYPNGGWPQIYPLAGGYHDLVTYNDGVMANVIRLLQDIERQAEDFKWMAENLRVQAAKARRSAIECVVNSQIRFEGKLLAWGQQHDPITLAPASARAFEMVSVVSQESSKILDLLMKQEDPSPAVIKAVDSAVVWFRAVAISRSEPEPGVVWARFYEIGTNRPLFGDRNGSIHYNLADVSEERRNGYAWYTDDPAGMLQRYLKWQKKHQIKTAPPNAP